MTYKMPWHRLTRTGVPAMLVIRRALRIDAERTLQVGDRYPAPKDPREAMRCRQYYESRRIGPAPVQEKSPAAPATESQKEQGRKRHGR